MAINQLHHERIDKGMRRPRLKRPPELKLDVGSNVVPAGLDPKIVLDRYLTESTTSQIATEFGVSRKTLVRWLQEVAPLAWKQVQLARAHVRKDDGDEGIENASDALSLARAREQLRSGQWDLERLDRDTYGQGPQVVINNGITSDQALESVAGALLDKLMDKVAIPHVSSTVEPQAIESKPLIVDK